MINFVEYAEYAEYAYDGVRPRKQQATHLARAGKRMSQKIDIYKYISTYVTDSHRHLGGRASVRVFGVFGVNKLFDLQNPRSERSVKYAPPAYAGGISA